VRSGTLAGMERHALAEVTVDVTYAADAILRSVVAFLGEYLSPAHRDDSAGRPDNTPASASA